TSFMTEMMFTTCVVAALTAGMMGLQKRSFALLLGAGLGVAAAFLTRQIGITLLLPLAAGLAMQPPLRWRPAAGLLLVRPPVLALLTFVLWRYASPTANATTTFTFAWALERWGQEPDFALELARRLSYMLVYLGAFTFPLLVI